MRFEFSTATQVIFGEGTLREAGPIAGSLGRRALVVAGSSSQRAQPLLSTLLKQGIEAQLFAVSGEPTVAVVRSGVELARRERCDLIIGFGGGSALDAAKAIAILLANPGDVTDYLEVIGQGKALDRPGPPVLTIPTTAGSGAEVTRNAVLGSPEHRVKVSLRSPHMLARAALVDPELTYSLPPAITASTGLDALTQLIEPFVSNKANPVTDAFCREGISLASHSLRRAHENGADQEARRGMALASLFGGFALANAKLGAVHGFASVLGGILQAPHGEICARLLPPVMEVNVRALHAREADNPVMARFDEVARMITSDPSAKAGDGVHWIQDLANELEIPPLALRGLHPDDFPTIIEKSTVASSMLGNPVQLTTQEMAEILERAL